VGANVRDSGRDAPRPGDAATVPPAPAADENLPAVEPGGIPDESAPAGLGTGESPSPTAPAGPGAREIESPEELKDRWLRAEAELQNFRRRARREVDDARRAGEERVMLEVIGALDDLERAIAVAREARAAEGWLQGVELVANRLAEGLARSGVTVLDPLGEPFDPEFHEAMLEVDPPAGSAPGSVVNVVLRGYRRGSRVLRAARVVVARRAPTES
jgi:molecular chaperone GrpE